MNYKQLKNLARLLTFTFESGIPRATEGTIKIADNNVELDINGGFRRICIYFTGNIYIYNNLPDGYYIAITDSFISINNLLLKKLRNDNILFRYDGTLEISKAYIVTLGGKKVNLKVEDIDRLDLINNSKTNLEDDSLLLLEEGIVVEDPLIRTGIDDDSIRGLFANKPLADGYTGYYNYHPKEKVYMSGKSITNESKPVGKSVSFFKKPKNKVILNKVLNKRLKKDVPIKTGTSQDIKTKSGKVEVKKITKGGKY
jgi:hypothetical protein